MALRARHRERAANEKLRARHPFDNEHGLGALRAPRLNAWCRLLRGRRRAEEEAATQERRGSFAVGEETEVADADQASGQNVNQEASQELICRNRHDLLLASARVILPAEGDAVLLECHQAMVGDGDAVSVASQIVENVLRPTEGRLRIDDPLLGEELAQELLEALGRCKLLKCAMELELVVKQELLESSGELAAEEAAENPDGQEEAWRSGDPSGAIEGKTAGRDHAVHMRMVLQVLSPRMQHAEQANIGPEVLRVASHFEQRCGAGAKEQIVK